MNYCTTVFSSCLSSLRHFFCIYVFGFCWVYIKRIMVLDDSTIRKAMIKTPASIVLIVYTFISVWFVGGLTAFHLYLISTNQTTYESFRYRYDWRANPYNRGVMQNFKVLIFLHPRTISVQRCPGNPRCQPGLQVGVL